MDQELGGDFIIAKNPQRGSKLPFLLRLPLNGETLWLKAAQTWPRGSRVYCHALEGPQPPMEQLDVLEQVPVIVCERRGSAIDLVLARGINRRSQFVFAFSNGRPLIFWQTAASVKAARPGLRIPGGRPISAQVIFIDSRERYGYAFSSYGVTTERRALKVGDYAAIVDSRVVAIVERKSMDDFIHSLVDGSLNFAMGELASITSAAVTVEGTYSALLRHEYTRNGFIPDAIARLAIRYPQVPVVFLESRKVAEEWAYRFLLAAYRNASSVPLPLLSIPKVTTLS